jgi:Uncharacterized protein conserved in bacteria
MRQKILSAVLFPCIAVTLALSGCSSPEKHRLMARTIAPATQKQIAAEHRIYLATNREPARDPGYIFSGDRNPDTTYAFVDVSVPAVHKVGEIERAPNPSVADPARYFTARRLGIFRSEQDYRQQLAKVIRERGGRALVFVHGYNTAFDDAVYRITQVAHDSGFPGAVILFTWPSAASVVDYLYDQNSVMVSRDALENLLRLVADAGATHIDLVAHSMGSLATMEALRQLAITNDPNLGGKLADVILASPDIDADVFKSQIQRMGKPKMNMVILSSRNDRALDLSGLIAGRRERLGAVLNAEEFAKLGVTVVDVTGMQAGDPLNHTKFADNPALVKLLGVALTSDDLEQLDDDDTITEELSSISRNIGRTVGNAAGIIITTPFRVFELALD